MAETTSSRLLRLLALLQARRDWPGSELAERLEVSGRTIRRDVDRLRELGYPVESLSGRAGGYRLAAGTAMPPLLLDDDEAIAIAIGLQTAAKSAVSGIEEKAIGALVKLEQVLPAHLRRRVRALQDATTTVTWPATETVDAHVLTLLAAACRDYQRVRFVYSRRDSERSRRETEPHSLVNVGRRWYLVAWDCDRGAFRTFRADRIESAADTGVRGMKRTLPGRKSAAEYVSASIGRMPHRYTARVTLECGAAELAGRLDRSAQLDELGDGRCELRTGDDDLRWLAARVLSLGVDFRVHEPPELIEHLRDLAARIGRSTGD